MSVAFPSASAVEASSATSTGDDPGLRRPRRDRVVCREPLVAHGAEAVDGASSFRGADGVTRGPAAVEGGIVLSRFERHLGPGSRSAAELET